MIFTYNYLQHNSGLRSIEFKHSTRASVLEAPESLKQGHSDPHSDVAPE